MCINDVDARYSLQAAKTLWHQLVNQTDPHPITIETYHRHSDGVEFPVELRMGRLDYGGEPAILALARDITERRRAEDRVRIRERMFREVFEASEDAILILDGDTFIDCNDAAVRMLRCQSKDEVPSSPWALSPDYQPDGRTSAEKTEAILQQAFRSYFYRFEWICTRADGEDFPVEVTLTPVDYDGRRVLYTVLMDITQRKEREGEIVRLANYDPLTDLPNRRLLQERGKQALTVAERQGRSLGVMYLDLNRFKDINDTQGHDIGDALLASISHPLAGCFRQSDTLARVGGDEFACLLPDADLEATCDIAQRVLSVFDSPFTVACNSIRIGVSIGLVNFPKDGTNLTELLKNADIAMYHAKTQGGGYVVFQPEQSTQVNERVALERELESALSQNELVLHYQPRIDVTAGNRVSSLEALVCWPHAERGWISPADFIPVAESCGMIHKLGAQVLDMACAQIRQWHARGMGRRVAVNLSARELERADIADEIAAALAKHAISGEWLEIEVTETAAMADPEHTVDTLIAIKALGVQVAIDDFGTGYSSLSHLKRLPADTLKIDKTFVQGMTEGTTDLGVVESIVALARSLGLGQIAEGVETEAQAEALQRLGCTEMQGFLYARPEPPESTELLL